MLCVLLYIRKILIAICNFPFKFFFYSLALIINNDNNKKIECACLFICFEFFFKIIIINHLNIYVCYKLFIYKSLNNNLSKKAI